MTTNEDATDPGNPSTKSFQLPSDPTDSDSESGDSKFPLKAVEPNESAAIEVPEQTNTTEASQAPNATDADQPDSDTADSQSTATSAEGDHSSESVGADKSTDAVAAESSLAVDKPVASGGTGSKTKSARPPQKKKKKKKKKKQPDDPFKDYHNFEQPLGKLPFHRILAINRGERAGNLKVRIKVDEEKLLALATEKLVSENHPFAVFMQSCVKDALQRLMLPSLEREIRRELTEAAEKHAVEVFAHNLQNLLLQSPVQNQTIMAIDPGYKRGCSVAVIDAGGKFQESSHIFVVGNQKRRANSIETIVELVKRHNVDLIAVGNGAACREAEQLVSDMIAEHFADTNLKYTMVSEAGASFYSTSEIGREELPDLTPAVRSAVSIGRRLLDPLSELVKISPANIGVGMYQHDIKAKHLSESLDEVVQFCVNRVGVNVNTASPSLLKYVSGLNQLTARRVFEYRQKNGPFKNRQDLKKVTGFGDATFVQSAGFLRIRCGDRPLDATSIHPESYELVDRILDRVNATIEELLPQVPAREESPPESTPPPPEPTSAGSSDTPTETSSDVTEISDQIAASEATATEATALDQAVENGSESVPAVSETATAGADPGTASTECTEASASAEAPADASNPSELKDAGAAESAVETQSVETKSVEKQSVEKQSVETQPSPSAPQAATELSAPQLPPEVVERRKEVVRKVRELDLERLAREFGVGNMMLKDVVQVLCRPEYDPRRKINRPVFRKGILKADELKPEMQLDAQVVNVVDFGVFVDIGLGTSCLVHVSQLANRYIHDPHRFFAVGDVLRVWVTEVDTVQRRVKLTAIKPGTGGKPRGNRGTRGTRGPKSRHRDSGRTGRRPPKKGGGRHSRHDKPRRKPPKPVKPITDEMLEGNAPMRSFSDLVQFFDKKDTGSQANADDAGDSKSGDQ